MELTPQNYKLPQKIINLSAAKTWDHARLEWRLHEISHQDKPETCLCGHFPINELCYLLNIKNGRIALVGNVCVKKFLGLPSDKIFDAIHRITKDVSKAVNPNTIEHALEKGWITLRDRNFYLNTWRQRSLSHKQSLWRVHINNRIIRQVKNATPAAPVPSPAQLR